MAGPAERFGRRQERVRFRVRKAGAGRPRLTVFRSGKNIYAQLIDDVQGITIAAASTLEKDVKGAIKSGATKEAAAKVGALLAQRATAKGVSEVVFDRGGYMFHGRIKALADGAREAGLKF